MRWIEAEIGASEVGVREALVGRVALMDTKSFWDGVMVGIGWVSFSGFNSSWGVSASL
jgi:hypothetical protein